MALCRDIEGAKLLADVLLSDAASESTTSQAKDFSWVITQKDSGYLFYPNTRTIKADISTVWAVVKDVQHYQQFSQGSVTAKNTQLAIGAAISFDIQVYSCGGYKLHSDETISVLDEENKILGWERKLPLVSEPTERYHMLEKSLVNPNQTLSRIALRIPPGFIGFFTDKIYKDTLEQAFDDLHAGIQQAAERKNTL